MTTSANHRMTLQDSCPDCDGQGALPCTSCSCARCDAGGKIIVPCSACQDGQCGCRLCAGSGQAMAKKGWFSRQAGTCTACQGKGRTRCEVCNGASGVERVCPECAGAGCHALCQECNATRKAECAMCFGSGHVESDQLRTFRSMAIEGLRGESEKRQREIHHLETKISRLRREHKVLWEEWQQYLGDAPDESMYGVYCDRMLSEIAEFDQDADRFKAEIAIIETVIRQKVEAERSGQNATVQLSDLAVAVGGFGAAPFAAETARTSRA